jgi:signal transduction histidine kinase
VVETTNSSTRGGADLANWAWQVSLLAFLYFAAGRLGLELTHYRDNATLVWPPTGLSFAALILFGVRLWPGVFIGTILVNVGSSVGWMPSLGIAMGNTLEAVVGVTLLMRVADLRLDMKRQRDIVAFLLIGVIGCTTLSAMIGTASLALAGTVEFANFWQVWLVWWMGNAGGALIVTPILLIMVHGNPSWRALGGRFESWLALVILLATTLIAFVGPSLGLVGFAACVAPFPVLVWVGTRLGPRGATLALFCIVVIATTATGMGSGPFILGTTTEAMILLWAYSVFMGITAFTMATVVEQRNYADRRYRFEEAERIRTEQQKVLLVERERLTREMHDGLGGQLVSVLSMVERGQAGQNEVAEAIRRAIDDIRIVIDSLDPNTTNLSTSLGKLRGRLEPLLRRNGVQLSWSIDDVPGLDTFPPESALHVLRIIQEAVTNTLRHASADRVEVSVTSSEADRGQFRLSVSDDGHGLSPRKPSGGRGIRNIKSRAKELGAEISIEGTNSGTKVDLTIPLPS